MIDKLVQHIVHSHEYNAGGVTEIYLLDIRDFISYKFVDDELYNSCLVEKINTVSPNYIRLDVVDESSFIEDFDNGIYRQELNSFVRILDHAKTASLLLTRMNKYLIVLRTFQGDLFTFGSDGGASVRFSEQTGKLGEATGYAITINKNSIYPLFETDPTVLDTQVIATENLRPITTESGLALLV